MGAVLACATTNLCECAACMACSCLGSVVSMTLGQAARLGHLLLFISVFVFASLMGNQYQTSLVGVSYVTYGYIPIPASLNIESLVEDCDGLYVNECIANQVIYRASCILTFFFLAMAICASYSDSLNRGMWGLKILVVFGVFIGFWYGSNSFFSGFAEVARILSFFWLLIQGLLVLDMAHDAHDMIMLKAEAEEKSSNGSSSIWKLTYIFFTLCFLTMGIIGLNYLFQADGGYTGCGTGSFAVIFGLIVCLTQLILSVLNSVNRGILTPCIMFAYATFCVWYALLSSPDIECNPSALENNSESKSAALWLVISLSMCILLFCVINGTRIMQIFMVSGEGVLESGVYGGYKAKDNGLEDGVSSVSAGGEGTKPAEIGYTMDREGDDDDAPVGSSNSTNKALADPNSTGGAKERMFFHVLMALASCYGGMVMSSWGRTNGAPEGIMGTGASGHESMWLKLVSLWIFYLMYYKALHLAYLKQSGN